ncbi:MAG: thioredoxin family protein [Bacteroidales bacterium]|jgi:thioredoxin-related protein|nr:thioredoxin family protein [Bacteroidales bacterium]
MKKLALVIIVIVSFASVSNAQSEGFDFDEAKSKAMESNTNIMIFFHGSDWCAPCIKLNNQVIDTEEFKTWADNNVIFVDADFPRRHRNQLDEIQQDKNKELAEKYNQQGQFPLIVILDKEGKVICTAGYKDMGSKEYIAYLESKL